MDASKRAKHPRKGRGVKRPKGKLAEHPAMDRLAENVAKLDTAQRERLAAFLDAPTITEQLRTAIDASGMTRYAIHKLTGIDQAALSRFMAGESGFSLENLDVLCRVLGLELRRIRRAKKGG